MSRFFAFVRVVLYWTWVSLMAALSLGIIGWITWAVVINEHGKGLSTPTRWILFCAVLVIVLLPWRWWQNSRRREAKERAEADQRRIEREQEKAEYDAWYDSLSDEEKAEEDERIEQEEAEAAAEARERAAVYAAARAAEASRAAAEEAARAARASYNVSTPEKGSPARNSANICYQGFEVRGPQLLTVACQSRSLNFAISQLEQIKSRSPTKNFILVEMDGNTRGATMFSL